jgi:hypothetical protein
LVQQFMANQNNKNILYLFMTASQTRKNYEFYRKDSYINDEGMETIYYNSVGCKKIKVIKFRKSVHNNLLLNNPDAPATAHQCLPVEIPKSEALHIQRSPGRDPK